MRWPRFTIGRMMVVVSIMAVALGLLIPAVATVRESPTHLHLWVNAWDGVATAEFGILPPPSFGVRYWRRLTGQARSAANPAGCALAHDRLAEICYYNHPGVLPGGAIIPDRITPTPTMLAILQQAGPPIRLDRKPAVVPPTPLVSIFSRPADATPFQLKFADPGQASQAGGPDPDR